MKHAFYKITTLILFFMFSFMFIARFAGPAILRLYVEAGMGGGDSYRQPIFCLAPDDEINVPEIDKNYISGLTVFTFPELKIRVPKEFAVVKAMLTKTFYKKRKFNQHESVVYLLYQKPNFFINLFPQLKKQGVYNDREFITRVMYAKTKSINSLTDAFFAIMKSMFTPNLGDQKNLKMAKFRGNDREGFITYNLTDKGNYFDCNILDGEGHFFKVYIRDENNKLDLDKVFAIISTIERTAN